jgi:hypothetical protein
MLYSSRMPTTLTAYTYECSSLLRRGSNAEYTPTSLVSPRPMQHEKQPQHSKRKYVRRRSEKQYALEVVNSHLLIVSARWLPLGILLTCESTSDTLPDTSYTREDSLSHGKDAICCPRDDGLQPLPYPRTNGGSSLGQARCHSSAITRCNAFSDTLPNKQ